MSPASDAQTVLHTLATRLDRSPDQGFTTDTLQARAELLRASADLLSDEGRRVAYESDLTALASAEGTVVAALEVPSSREVAGLLLLLEAGQAADCFELACRSLQPPQAPTLGSSREADLTLLAGLACLAAAEEAKQSRHFESAAGILRQGLQLLQRMGQVPEMRERMSRELERLTPYRVLDLLSRDLAAKGERAEGLALLEQLVQQRGGLESNSDPDFSAEEFQAFFRQIRGFLTVQEQVDLFSRWGDDGSAAANFLASTALTASGFAQRKPERIAAARDRLQASGRSGIEPLVANLHLLLGDVDTARAIFEGSANKDLKAWAARHSDDPLAQLCAYCSDWLGRDVLPGYRDLDADPDLEAYFSDRDVVAWVEREDRRHGRSFGPPMAPVPGEVTAISSSSAGDGDLGSFDWSLPPASPDAGEQAFSDADPEDEETPLSWGLPELNLPRIPLPAPRLLAGAVVVLLALLGGAWLLRSRPAAPPSPGGAPARGVVEIPVQPSGSKPAEPGSPSAPARPAEPSTPAEPPKPSEGQAQTKPSDSQALTRPNGEQPPATASQPSATLTPTALTASEPSEAQLRSLLESWLAIKTKVLGGASLPPDLEIIARQSMVDRLAGERRQDAAGAAVQTIEVSITDLAIQERTPNRIAIQATLRYRDSRRNSAGKVVETTPATTLRNVYVFGRDGDRWRLAASHAAG